MSKVDTKEVYVAVKFLSVVWIQAQRPYRENWAKEIAANFDTDKFDPPVITKPNGAGYYHIVEGQHRVKAVEMVFGVEEKLKCRMVDAEDPARAAEIFLGINSGRKAIKPVDKFNVAVVANREPEVPINRLVNQLGYTVSQAKSDHTISAVNSLLHVHKLQGMPVLKAVLVSLDATWEGDPAAFQGDIVRGYAAFINEFHTTLDPKRLIIAATKYFGAPHRLLTSSRTYAEQHKCSLTEAMSETLRSRYNLNLKEGQKLRRK